MNSYRIAKIISTFTNPPILCIPLFLIISLVLSFENGEFVLSKFIVLELISIVFASVLPMAIILYWAKRLNTDGDISNRQDRFIPLIVGVISYFIGFCVSYILNADSFMTVLLLCYAVNTFIVMIITTKWKISIHTTGLSGPVGALILLLGPVGALFAVLYPILIWSRVTLEKHTMAQAVAGGVQGFFLTIIEMYLFMNVLNVSFGEICPLDLSALYILAVIATPVLFGFLSYVELPKSAFYIAEAVLFILFLLFTPASVFVIFALISVTSVAVALYAGRDYSWFRVMKSS